MRAAVPSLLRRLVRRALLAAGLAVLLLSAVSPAEAHSRRHDRHRDRHHRHAAVSHRHFAVPHRIVRHDLHLYRPYFYGDFYYRPHRHRHAVYRFPVAADYGVIYERYAYCGDDLFVGGSVSFGSPRVHVRVGF